MEMQSVIMLLGEGNGSCHRCHVLLFRRDLRQRGLNPLPPPPSPLPPTNNDDEKLHPKSTSDAGHNIVADGWAGASNPHPYPNPPPTLKHTQLVIQGSHMVSGTRCPAGSDPVKKWSESRAAAPKGRCPVEHRGEFPYVLRGHISGLR